MLAAPLKQPILPTEVRPSPNAPLAQQSETFPYEYVAPSSGWPLRGWAGVVAVLFAFASWWTWKKTKLREEIYREFAPIEFLATAEEAHNPQRWYFSHPLFFGKLPQCVNLSFLRGIKGSGGFIDAESRVLDVLSNTDDSKGPVIVVVQSGMGIGKSYIIDIADQLLFVGRNPIVLKVSYNFAQNLDLEGELCNAGEGLLARIVLCTARTILATLSAFQH